MSSFLPNEQVKHVGPPVVCQTTGGTLLQLRTGRATQLIRLTIQVGNNGGRPAAAQSEWIAKFSEQTDALLKQFEAVKRGSVAQVNGLVRQ
jgi:hypothetical protein